MKIVYTFEGEEWKKYKYPPICYLLSYLFSTNRFIAPYNNPGGYDFGFYKFKEIIYHKIEDYEITTENDIKCFEFNRPFYTVFNIVDTGMSEITGEVALKERAISIMEEDNVLRIYNGWSELYKNVLLAELSVKKNGIEINTDDIMYEEKIIKLKSLADIMEDVEVLLTIKSYIENNYKSIAFSCKILDDLDKEYKNKNYEILNSLENESGITMKKSDLIPDTQFKIDKEFFKLSDIDKTIENLNKLKILFISLQFVNKRRKLK